MVHLKHVDIQKVPLIMSLSERKYNLTLLRDIYLDFLHLTGSGVCDGHFMMCYKSCKADGHCICEKCNVLSKECLFAIFLQNMHNGRNVIKSSVKISVSAVPCMATELKPGPCAIKAVQQLLSLDFEARGQYF
jgi:hypothetical protein